MDPLRAFLGVGSTTEDGKFTTARRWKATNMPHEGCHVPDRPALVPRTIGDFGGNDIINGLSAVGNMAGPICL